jgi:calcineurin-like phosphoesterase family protein
MNLDIIKRWNEQVQPEDIVYILGDISLNPKYAFQYAPLLNGIKILIAGNHDSCFDFKNTIKGANAKLKYEEAGYIVLQEAWVTLPNSYYKVKLSHFPFASDIGLEYDERYKFFRTPYSESYTLLHGHLHSKYRKYNNMIDVGFDGDLKLWSSDEIVELIRDKRKYIPTPITEYYKQRALTEPRKDNMKGKDI